MPRSQRAILIAAVLLAVGYAWLRGAFLSASAGPVAEPAVPATARLATFAAGCFWSAEHVFEGVPGVWSVVAGYTGGMNALDSLGLMPVVVPADDIREVAKQAQKGGQ